MFTPYTHLPLVAQKESLCFSPSRQYVVSTQLANLESSLKKPHVAYNIFFSNTNIRLLFVLVDFCGASSCSRTSCRQVARYVHDPNGIIDARSASPLAPDLVAAISDEGVWNLASSRHQSFFFSKVHNAVRYFNIGPHCVPIWDIKRCL